jgi:hypothetical protein
MWQPKRSQWAIIWPIALLVILFWPPESGRSLGVKALNWAVDPFGSLPPFPAALPMGLDDDGDAVAAHDALQRDYDSAYDRSAMNRWRMTLKAAVDPLEPQTERQVLIALAVIGALGVWKLQASGHQGIGSSGQ